MNGGRAFHNVNIHMKKLKTLDNNGVALYTTITSTKQQSKRHKLLRIRPVGQVVKTAASHAANRSSTLLRVTSNIQRRTIERWFVFGLFLREFVCSSFTVFGEIVISRFSFSASSRSSSNFADFVMIQALITNVSMSLGGPTRSIW